jgi:hypothetical protein
MPDYRIYTMGSSGHIEWAPAAAVFPNDTAVIEHAKKLLDGHPIQIWDGPRLVISLKPDHVPLWGSAPVFEADVLKALGEAYDMVVDELSKGGHTQLGKEALAARIVLLAKNGERNPDRMARLILDGHA